MPRMRSRSARTACESDIGSSCPGARSQSMPRCANVRRTMLSCWPLLSSRAEQPSLARKAVTRLASLRHSGRVPATTRTPASPCKRVFRCFPLPSGCARSGGALRFRLGTPELTIDYRKLQKFTCALAHETGAFFPDLCCRRWRGNSPGSLRAGKLSLYQHRNCAAS